MRKAILAGCAAAALFATGLAASPASAVPIGDTANPPADKLAVKLVTVNGSGCPAGTAAVAVAPDNTAFTVTYSSYLAQVGVGAEPTDFRKNCQLNVAVQAPQGFTYAIARATYRGFASLAKGASAVQRANYYFSGQSQTAYRQHTYKGPLEDSWQSDDETDVAAMVWAPCGKQLLLNINTDLRVNAGTSNKATTTSFMSMDSTDGSIDTIYHFSWRKCPA